MMVKDKKANTTTGSCNYLEEEYAITELVSANEYKKLEKRLNDVENDFLSVKTSLYDKTLISSVDNDVKTINEEINNVNLNQGEAANKKIIVDALKYSELGITEDMSWEEIGNKLLDMYPELPIGTTYNFAYTGGIQEWSAPSSGVYKLEVWGGKGGDTEYVAPKAYGGHGGYSIGYINFSKGDKIYIVVGGSGGNALRHQYTAGSDVHASGGYNGGGAASTSGGYRAIAGGGGATHIATMTGVLSSLSANKDKILIVAGGGGGAQDGAAGGETWNGGTGGGASGGNGTIGNNRGYGGTQTSGYAFGAGETGYFCGGGYYGGQSLNHQYGSCGGGSGYIGGVTDASTSNGVNNGNGKAVITYVASK